MSQEIRVASGVCWDLDQLADEIEKHDQHNEIIKVEVTHGFEPGRKCYRWIIWTYPVSDEDQLPDPTPRRHRSPGPARGLTTNIRSSPDAVSPNAVSRVGFRPVQA